MKIQTATLTLPVGCTPDDAADPDLPRVADVFHELGPDPRECAHVSTVWSGPGFALQCPSCGRVWS